MRRDKDAGPENPCLVVGRVATPNWSAATAEMWKRQTEAGFDFDRSALEDEPDNHGWIGIF